MKQPCARAPPGRRLLHLHDAFINDAILAGHATVHVIHGRGAGRLKAAVHQRLATFAAVRHVRVDPANAGVTVAT
ncbi:MAG: Smr/MutS family protein [Acidobacteria bacterium]|nr:Smr/MutS family protein [Acidobacteriota bacterium]